MTTTYDIPTDETTEEGVARLPRPLYAVAGVSELAYRRLQRLPEQVEALRERLTPRVRTLREELPGRVTTLVARSRQVYGGLVARGEEIVDAARTRRVAHTPEPRPHTEPRGIALVAEDATED